MEPGGDGDGPTCARTSALAETGPASSTQLQVPAWQGEGRVWGARHSLLCLPSEQRDQSGIT